MQEAEAIYNCLKDENGRIVTQVCGKNFANAVGGRTTEIFDNLEEFIAFTKISNSYVKVAKYVDGYNMNISFFAGNTLPNRYGYGLTRTYLGEDDDPFSSGTLDSLTIQAQRLGIDQSNIFVAAGKPTLKVVGDSRLTSSTTNGVGNVINYKFNASINEQVEFITQKLGKTMALAGKVGLSGIDFMVKNGRVYVNEINDRQQGTTAPFSRFAEKFGCLGLSQIDFVLQFANLNGKEEILELLRENSTKLYGGLEDAPEFFYIKIVALEDCTSKMPMPQGVYQLDSQYRFQKQDDQVLSECTDLGDLPTQVEISGSSLSAGEFVPKGTQVMRLQGYGYSESMPFVLQGNKSILNPLWYQLIDKLYADLFCEKEFSSRNEQDNV